MSAVARSSYGTSAIRLAKVTRRGDRHDVKDLTVDVIIDGEFEDAYEAGDNVTVLPSETIRSTIFALARQHPIDQLELFGLTVAGHFLTNNPQVFGVRISLAERLWKRIAIGEKAHGQAFMAPGDERRLATVHATGGKALVSAGIEHLPLLKTSAARFEGFLPDRYATGKEAGARILATVLSAWWQYADAELSYGNTWQGVRQLLLETFAQHDSRSMQHLLYAMGETVLESYGDIDEIRLSLPDRGHFPADLSAIGLSNEAEIFMPSEEPFGPVEATIKRHS